jgi:hypothetical protein
MQRDETSVSQGTSQPRGTSGAVESSSNRIPAPALANIMTVDSLRRSSPAAARRVTPTRILRLTEAEHQQQVRESAGGTSPFRLLLTAESLSNRPRSNPRNRTPRRYESPLDPDEFRLRRDQDGEGDAHANENNGQQPRRITIRPLAGTAVGTFPSSARVSYGASR